MSHPLEGVTRAVGLSAVSSGAGVTTVNIRPDAGKVWELLWCTGQQDDGVVLIQWFLVDPDASTNLLAANSAGAGIKWPFGALTDTVATTNGFLLGPIVLSYDRYLQYCFTASAGSKTGSVICIVREYRGVSVEA